MKEFLLNTAKKYLEDNGLKFGVKQTYRDVPNLSNGILSSYLDVEFIPTSVIFKSYGHRPSLVVMGKLFKKDGEEKKFENVLFDYDLNTNTWDTK